MTKLEEVEKIIDGINHHIDQALFSKRKMDNNKAELLHYARMAEQNLKFLRKGNSLTVLEEFKKIRKAYIISLENIKTISNQIEAIQKAIENLTKDLEKNKLMLEREKKKNEPKVLEFKRG